MIFFIIVLFIVFKNYPISLFLGKSPIRPTKLILSPFYQQVGR